MKINKRTKTLVNLAFWAGMCLKGKPGSGPRFLKALWASFDDVPVAKKEESNIVEFGEQQWKQCSECGEYALIQYLEYGDICPSCSEKKEK